MKKQKVLALVLSLVMVISMLAACGKTENGDNPSNDEVSIDFEDSKSAFALVKSYPRKADESSLTVKTVNDSKVLYVANEKGGVEMYLAIDLDGLLGANISKLAKVEVTIGLDRPDGGKFAAAAGETYIYAGASADALAETKVGTWSVYTTSKNPSTFTFDVSGVELTAGADTYLTLVKNDDTGATPSNFYIDNLKFLDKDGKLIDVNKDVVMEPVGNKFVKEPEKPDTSAGIVVEGDASYTGDWTLGGTVPNAVLANFEGDIDVTLKFELTGDKDYYIACPIDSWWADKFGASGKILGLEVKSSGDETNPTFHLQADGGLVIDNRELTELTYTLSAEAVKQMVADGKDLAAMVYGVTIYQVVVANKATGGSITEKIEGNSSYTGDWTLGGTIPNAVLAKFSGDIDVTLKFELTGDKDYYIACPIDSWWADKFGAKGEILGLEVKSEGDAENPTFHLQADGGLVIDNRGLTELTYTLSADAVKRMVADGKDLAAMVYGVTIYEVVVSGKAKQTAQVKIEGDSAYTGDWTLGGTIPSAQLAQFAGDIDVTLKFELTGDKDYYIACPIDSWWADKFGASGNILGLEVKSAADETNPTFHLQADGGLVIDNRELTELTYTLSAAAVKQMVADGKDLAAMVYGVTIYEVIVSGEVKNTITEKVADELTGSAWGQDGKIPASVLAKFAGDITITMLYTADASAEQSVAAPMDASWKKIYVEIPGSITGLEEADEIGKIKPDGFIKCDPTKDSITFTLTAAGIEYFVTNGVDFTCQVFGLEIDEFKLEGEAK